MTERPFAHNDPRHLVYSSWQLNEVTLTTSVARLTRLHSDE